MVTFRIALPHSNREIKGRLAKILKTPFPGFYGFLVGTNDIWSYLLKKGKIIVLGDELAAVYYRKNIFIYGPEYTAEPITCFSRTMLVRILNDIISKRGDE